jgi:hypothetical protein
MTIPLRSRALRSLLPLALLLASLPAQAGAPQPKPAYTPPPGPEENLLAEPEEPSEQDDRISGERSAEESFGTELSLLNLEATWSGYGDFVFVMQRGTPSSFNAAHFNPILTARMGAKLNAEVEIEIEPEGIAVEYAILDYAISRSFTLRFGKFLVPFGHFNEVLHPSFRWNMATRPLMMREAVPATWVDFGIQARGSVDLGAGNTVNYAAWVANGLGGGDDFRESTNVVRSLRDNFADNNSDKALGARLSFDLMRGKSFGNTRLGFSAYTGAVNDAATERLSLVGVDASVRLGDFTLRGEASQSFLGSESSPLEQFERGVYTQLSYKLGPVDLSTRWDYIRLRPRGAEAPSQQQVAVGVSYSPVNFLILRAEGAFALKAPQNTPPRFSAMTAFSF